MSWSPKARLFWPIVVGAVCLDVLTKLWAESALTEHVPHRVIGNVVRLTLGHNAGAAFGMSVGIYSRIAFSLFAIAGIAVIGAMYAKTPPEERMRAAALGLIIGGAIGNLINRFHSPAGVTDFIDVGTTSWRFWTFNVADSCITVGAVLLLWALRDESRGNEVGVQPRQEHS